MEPNSSFKRKGREENKPYLTLKYQERNFLNKWLKQKGIPYLQKFENVPEIILTDYEKHGAEKKVSFDKPFTSPERLYFIKSKLHWHLHLNPKFQKMLKVAGINSGQFGLLFGYSSPGTFYNSTAKDRVVIGATDLADKIIAFMQGTGKQKGQR